MDDLRNFTLQLSLANKATYKFLLALLDSGIDIYSIYKLHKKGKLPELNLANLSIGKLAIELQRRHIKYICFWESTYPVLLKECNDFPLVLYYVGNFDILNNKELLSIVGTRKITSYGKGILEELIPNISNSIIVSGMAFGVDAYAHKLALDNNLPTIAVLPCSCGTPMPEGNRSLYNKILSKNLIISDIPPGIKLHKGLYPRRNRIIAGISQRTVIIEAGIKSGALITADLAFHYNREVFAYPGNINSSLSSGCNYLIKNNIAQLVENSHDLGFKNVLRVKVENLNPIERKVYCAILPGSKSLNDLSRILKMDVNFLASICTNLEINGILNTDNQNKFYVS